MLLIRWILFPFSLVYALIVKIRNWLYDKGFFKATSFDVPIICIGNLSVGGTGKTPMTDLLINGFKKNHQLAVLSRGYKRKSEGFIIANESHTVEDLGDEPFQLYSNNSDISLAVDADRVNGINQLLRLKKPEVILLDDAFQHRKVAPSFSILLTTYSAPFYADFYLPTGNLRDDKNQYKRADVIVVTKCPAVLSDEEIKRLKHKISPKANQTVLFTTFDYASHFKNNEEKFTFDDVKSKKLALVTGIANAKPLVNHLKSKGLEFKHFNFSDHHFFTPQEVEQFQEYEMIMTTEKDFTRLQHHVDNAVFLSVQHRFLNEGSAELSKLFKEQLTLDFLG